MDIQQSSKAHGLTYQILQWGYTATVCACLSVCMWVHVCVCMCDMHAHTHAHTVYVASWPMCLRLSISHHLWFTNILVAWTELSTEVHQTLLTCSGDVIHP